MFLVCGEALFDVFLTPEGAAPAMAPGGSPFNVAIGLARLGRPVAFAASLSGDALGRRLRRMLEAEGVDLSQARVLDGPTPLALVEVDDAGVPRYGFHGLREMEVHPTRPDIPGLDGLHVGSVPIVSAASAGPLLGLMAAVGVDRVTSFDPNVRLAVEPDAMHWRAQADRFRREARLVKASEDDMRAMHGADADVEAVARGWLGGRTALVVLTKGAAGMVLFGGAGVRVEVAAAASAVVDTVGAGDAVQAALIAWLQERGLATPAGLAGLGAADLDALGRFAAGAAAVACSRRGPDLPRRAELS